MSSIHSHDKSKIAKGSVFARPEIPTNSIPTPTVNVLHARHTLKGFGSSAGRFDGGNEPDREGPGPGAHVWKGDTLDGRVESIKKRKQAGAGGIGSKSQVLIHYKNTGPGPGSYDRQSDFQRTTKIARILSQSTLERQGMFKKESQLVVVKDRSGELRGPGSYDVKLPGSSNNPGVLFKSKTKRTIPIPNLPSSNIGFYEVGKNILPQKQYSMPANTSSFIRPSNQLLSVKINDYEKIRRIIEAKPLEQIRPDSLWNRGSIPGPGEYERDRISYMFNERETKKYNKIYKQPLSEKPIVTRHKLETPEPGRYDIKSSFDTDKYKVYNSMFLSTTKRYSQPRPTTDSIGPEKVNYVPIFHKPNSNPLKNWI